MLTRFSSRRSRLYDSFLKPYLTGAKSYFRIAGYFNSSLFDLADEDLFYIPEIRIVCNAEIQPSDLQTLRQATERRREEIQQSILRQVWNQGDFVRLVDIYGRRLQKRLQVLYNLIVQADQNRRFEIRIVPDAEFGFIHGKGGLIYGSDKNLAFIGSANDSKSAWSKNYELIWADDNPESIDWLQEEFTALWNKGLPLGDFIIKQIGRLGRRTIIEHVQDWQTKPVPEKLLAETPTSTRLWGFWDHQKYFIDLVFKEHRKYRTDKKRGARYLLCDSVGLGKTLQLGAVARLIGTLDEGPILIVAPKSLLEQWQDELWEKLALPSARWIGWGWITERNEFHPQLPDKTINCPRKIGLVSTSVVTSQAISESNRRLVEELLNLRYSCVIWDEAHKIRRANLSPSKVYKPPEKKSLYAWAEKLAEKCQTMLLATATPVQLHPMELWDLLYVLSINNPQVLGSANSLWRDTSGPRIFDIVMGRETVTREYEKWNYLRDPIPGPEIEPFEWIRQTLGLDITKDIAAGADMDKLDPADRQDLFDHKDLRQVNPFTRWIVKRRRDMLEEDGKLSKIEMVPIGDDRPIISTHSMQQALELAEKFAQMLHKRIKSSGFIKTLLQRRIGSSLDAGLKTANRMLGHGDLAYDEDLEEDVRTIYPLQLEENELLSRLRDHLEQHLQHEADPKFERVYQVLHEKFEGHTWVEMGVLIFSQFYDSALALAEYLAGKINEDIGIYAGYGASKLIENGQMRTIDREILKTRSSKGNLKILIGTDAASTGLNLQALGALINLDLPWNPTVLEQRKGRLQRGTIAKRIPYYNMRYDQGVEYRLFKTLSRRIQQITDIFGTIPDYIVDEWVERMLEDQEMDDNALIKLIEEKQENPFDIKQTREYLTADWDATEEILNEENVLERFQKGW